MPAEAYRLCFHVCLGSFATKPFRASADYCPLLPQSGQALAWLNCSLSAKTRHRLLAARLVRYVTLTIDGENLVATIRALFIAACSFLSLGAAATPDDVPSKTGAFVAYCKTNSEGCLNKVDNVSFAMLLSAKKVWCPAKETDDVKVLTDEIKALTPKLVGWLSAHPEVKNMTTDDGIKTALIQLYPCKR